MPKTESRLLNATRIAFLNCNDAKLHVIDACLTQEQAARLRGALAWLEECGLVLVPQGHADGGVTSFNGVVEQLAASVGSLSLNAALSCLPASPPRQGVKPAAVMPVWPLEPETTIGGGSDLLVSSARLWGADVLGCVDGIAAMLKLRIPESVSC